MNHTITAFLVFGACFGLATYGVRHLFSEGPTRRADAADRGHRGHRSSIPARVVWMLVCTFLWPIMALTGVYSLWRLTRRSRSAAAARANPPQ